jgi:hypothetical protein
MSDGPNAPSEAEAASIDEVLAQEKPSSSDDQSIDLESGLGTLGERASALDSTEANALAAENRPTVLVLAGSVGSGKTSVYAAIYERLGRGEFGGWMFAGSRTIAGLEERCFLWRTDSGNVVPAMEATRGNALPWLHIRLRDVERRGPARDLLMGDFDGERFDHVADGTIDPLTLPFLRRADHVGVVIDGKKIADRTQRVAVRNDVLNLLKALLKPGALAGMPSLFLVATKVDEFEKFGDAERRAANDALAAVEREASSVVGNPIPMLRLAVRSHVPDFPLGHGLESLLEMLLVHGHVHILNPPSTYKPSSALGRFRG